MTQLAQDEVGLGDKSVETSQYTRYKGQKDRTDRIAILSPALIRGFRYYQNNTNFRLPKEDDLAALIKEQFGEPEQRFGMLVFQYLTDEAGALIDPTKLQGKIKIWIISEARYEELSALHKQFPLMESGFDQPQHDLLIKCTEEKFQRMQFTPTPKAQWKQKQSWYEAIKAKASKGKEKVGLAIAPFRERSEIMTLLGMSTRSPTQAAAASDIDLSGVIEEGDAPAAKAAAGAPMSLSDDLPDLG